MKKLNQIGMFSLHVILPVALAIVLVGGIGAYVLTKSHAQTPADGGYAMSCGNVKQGGVVYYSVVGTKARFANAHNSDSIRNIASKLCAKGFMSKSEAAATMVSGNYSATVLRAYAAWQQGLGYSGSNADGVPGKASLAKLGLVPNGF